VRVQREVGISRDREVINGERVQRFGCLNLVRYCLRVAKLGQAVGDEEDENNEKAIRRALDLKVAEQRVGAEEIECFVDYICLFRIGNWGWTADSGLDWQNGHVPDLSNIGLFVQSRVICLRNH